MNTAGAVTRLGVEMGQSQDQSGYVGSVMAEVHLVMSGKLVITTPNARGWRARIEGINWREVQNPTHINLFTAQTLNDYLMEAGYSNAKRILRPVTYKAKGVKALGLAMTQMFGVDGGVSFVATNSNTGECSS